jgi:hypothetical protein
MLVHICCSVDSHYFLTRLKADFPNEKLIGFFYNPNIHPRAEYELRLQDARKSCGKLGIELIEGRYDDVFWYEAVKGFELCPEKGERCEICFDKRFEESAKKAAELGIKSFTSTLLQSPLKDKEQLKNSLQKISQKHGVDFVFVDYLSKGGMEAQNKAAKEAGLYRQNYCGCSWGLINQRAKKDEPIFESFSALAPRILPSSAEDRLDFYAKNNGKVFRARILDYRCLSAAIYANGELLVSYVLLYSSSQKESFSANVLLERDGVLYLDKDGARVVPLQKMNEFLEKSYKNTRELIFLPPTFEEEMKFRLSLIKHPFDMSPIFVVDEPIFDAKYKIELKFATSYSAMEQTP